MLYKSIALLVLLATHATHAFGSGSYAPQRTSRAAVKMVEDDPTGSPFIKAINQLQEAYMLDH